MGKEDKNKLAEERTEWANERTLLAKERSFAAWLRTSLAFIGSGLGAARLLGDAGPRSLVLALGVVLAATGIGAAVIGFMSYRKTLKELEDEGVRGVPMWVVSLFSLALLISGGLALALILL